MPVYVFGSGDCGQLGMGEDCVSAPHPISISSLQHLDIIQIAAGGLHSLALSANGQVFSWGCNDEKALGHAAEEFEVGEVKLPLNPGQRVMQICAGDSISACLTNDGRVYTWGTFRDSQGVMGHGADAEIQETPTLLTALAHLNIVSITAGANHLVALTSPDHRIYTWGCGEQGQLGRRVLERHKHLGLRPANVTPRHLTNRRMWHEIEKVVCGSYHTLAIAKDSTVYGMGLNNYGQLGLGDHEPRPTAESIEQEHWLGDKIVSAGAGEHHSVALSAQGRLFAFGRNDFGQLGIGHAALQGCRVSNTPHLIDVPIKFSMIAVGGNHSLAVDETKHQVWSWGYGEMGQLGHGVERDELEPRLICEFTLKSGEWISGIAAGGQHSIILTRFFDHHQPADYSPLPLVHFPPAPLQHQSGGIADQI